MARIKDDDCAASPHSSNWYGTQLRRSSRSVEGAPAEGHPADLEHPIPFPAQMPEMCRPANPHTCFITDPPLPFRHSNLQREQITQKMAAVHVTRTRMR